MKENNDDKRYTVALAKKGNPNCYVDQIECQELNEAKNQCIDLVCDEGRDGIVFDRCSCPSIVFKYKASEVKEDG